MRQSISPRSPQPSSESPQSIMEAKLQQLLLDPEKLSLPEIIGYLKRFRTTLSQQGYDETETQAALDRVLDEYFPVDVAVQRATVKSLSPTVTQPSINRQNIQMNRSNIVRLPRAPVHLGVAVPASKADIDARVAQTNGFESRSIADVLGSSIGVPEARRKDITALIEAELERRRGQALTNEELQQFRQDLLQAANNDAPRIHAFIVALIALVGLDRARDILWRSLSNVTLRRILSGFGIHKPVNAAGRRDWFHDVNQGRVDNPATAEEYSRYAFDELFDRYVRDGANGDKLPADAAARRQRRA
jgi:hypothetical protein